MSIGKDCTATNAKWDVKISKVADKKIRALDRPTRHRIADRLSQMVVDPYPVVQRLEGLDDLWSSRVGGWRIICAISDDVMVVAVLQVGRIGQVYDDLKSKR